MWHLGKDLIVNGVDIFDDIKTGISEYKAGNWENFGKDIGEASAKIFLGTRHKGEKELRAEKVQQLLKGFSNVNGFKFDLLDLLECIYAEDQAALALDVGVQ